MELYPVVLIKTHQLAVEWKLCKISYWKSDTFLINSIQIAFKFEWATFKHGVTKVTQQIMLNHRVKRKILNYICSSNCNGGQKIWRETRYREKKCISPHHLKLVSIWLQSVRSITFCRQALTAVKAKRLKTGSVAVTERTDSILQRRSTMYCQSCNCHLPDHLPAHLYMHSPQLQRTLLNLADPKAHTILRIYFKKSDLESNYVTSVFYRKEWYNTFQVKHLSRWFV